MTTLEETKSAFDALSAEQDALIAKMNGGTATAEEVAQAQENAPKLTGYVEQIKSLKTLAQLNEQHEAIQQFMSEPEMPDFMEAAARYSGIGTFKNGVSVLGFHRDGEMSLNSTKHGLEAEHLSDVNFKAEAFKACRSEEYRTLMRRYLKGSFAEFSNAEQKTLQEGADTSGGFLAPEEILARIVQKQPTPTRVQNFVDSITIGRDSVLMPKVNYATDDLYTTGIRATWTGEVPASSTVHRVTDPVFGSIRIPVYTAMLSIPLTNDFMEDGMIDVLGWVSGKFGETIELLKDNMILNGTGINQPSGILLNPNAANNPATVVTGDASNLTVDGLIDLTESVPEQYDENARLIFNKTNTGKAIRKLKDGNGRPIFSYGITDAGYAGGRAGDINGYPYSWSGFMPNVGAGTYPIIFGDLRGYTMVNRIGPSLQVLRELYAETNQVLLLGRVRFGGAVVEDWRLKVQEVSA